MKILMGKPYLSTMEFFFYNPKKFSTMDKIFYNLQKWVGKNLLQPFKYRSFTRLFEPFVWVFGFGFPENFNRLEYVYLWKFLVFFHYHFYKL